MAYLVTLVFRTYHNYNMYSISKREELINELNNFFKNDTHYIFCKGTFTNTQLCKHEVSISNTISGFAVRMFYDNHAVVYEVKLNIEDCLNLIYDMSLSNKYMVEDNGYFIKHGCPLKIALEHDGIFKY